MVILLDRIQKYATKRIITILYLLTLALSIVMMGALAPIILTQSGGLPILDMWLNYSPSDASNFLTALGPDGRQLYLVLKAVDMIYPLAYGFAFALTIANMTAHLYPVHRKYGVVTSLPLLAAFTDYIENVLHIIQITSYPNLSDIIFTLANYITIVKFVFLLTGVLVILLLILIHLFRKMKN